MTAREQQARGGIARCRALAEGVAHFPSPWTADPPAPGESGEWLVLHDGHTADSGCVAITPDYGRMDLADFIAANDPAHVLAVLAAAEATLDRHADADCCHIVVGTMLNRRWAPCAEAAAVLDLYAGEVTS